MKNDNPKNEDMMEKNINKKDQDHKDKQNFEDESDSKKVEKKSLEEKLKESEDKVLRSLAEIENQRRRMKFCFWFCVVFPVQRCHELGLEISVVWFNFFFYNHSPDSNYRLY